MQTVDTYKETKVFHFPGAVVRVSSPVLTLEEHERRMKAIHDAAADLLRDYRKTEGGAGRHELNQR